MAGRDPDLHPAKTYLVGYPGGGVLLVRASSGTAAVRHAGRVTGSESGVRVLHVASAQEVFDMVSQGVGITTAPRDGDEEPRCTVV